MNQNKLKKELESILEWIKSSKEDFVGETRINSLFTIEHIEKILKEN